MAKYIEREAVIEAICQGCKEQFGAEPCEPSECCLLYAVKTVHAADVAPVRHGRWIATYGDSWKCSVCGAESYVDEDWHGKDDKSYLMNYCHYCGAKMDEGTE